MKDAFWTVGNPKYMPYEFTRRAIAAKIADEKPKPPATASNMRKCQSCGRMTSTPCR